MTPPLTPAVARALEQAARHAHGAASLEIQPAHLLAALLSEEEGQAATLAVAHGLDLAAWGAFRSACRRGGGIARFAFPGSGLR